ncbi:hypothetical protein IAT40_005010 [Kwoniella sp. CBS 6097]
MSLLLGRGSGQTSSRTPSSTSIFEHVVSSLAEQIGSLMAETNPAAPTAVQLALLAYAQKARIDKRPNGMYAVVAPLTEDADARTYAGSRITAPTLADTDLEKRFHQAEQYTIEDNARLLADKLGSTLETMTHTPVPSDHTLPFLQRPATDDHLQLSELACTYDLPAGFATVRSQVEDQIKSELERQTELRHADGRSGQGTPSDIFFLPELKTEEDNPNCPSALRMGWSGTSYFDGPTPSGMPARIDFSKLDVDWDEFRR